jgi:hypothetical protein
MLQNAKVFEFFHSIKKGAGIRNIAAQFSRPTTAGHHSAMGEDEDMPRKEVYCETCGSNQTMIEHEPQKDELNPYPWYGHHLRHLPFDYRERPNRA